MDVCVFVLTAREYSESNGRQFRLLNCCYFDVSNKTADTVRLNIERSWADYSAVLKHSRADFLFVLDTFVVVYRNTFAAAVYSSVHEFHTYVCSCRAVHMISTEFFHSFWLYASYNCVCAVDNFAMIATFSYCMFFFFIHFNRTKAREWFEYLTLFFDVRLDFSAWVAQKELTP